MGKRREFEYRLRRHEARKLDYMRYVEHETNLESLRALRTRRAAAGRKKDPITSSDTSCVRLIRWIFDRAVLKFPEDVDLWLHYIDFAGRQGQTKVRTASVATEEGEGTVRRTERQIGHGREGGGFCLAFTPYTGFLCGFLTATACMIIHRKWSPFVLPCFERNVLQNTQPSMHAASTHSASCHAVGSALVCNVKIWLAVAFRCTYRVLIVVCSNT